jgi:hypothetical protein
MKPQLKIPQNIVYNFLLVVISFIALSPGVPKFLAISLALITIAYSTILAITNWRVISKEKRAVEIISDTEKRMKSLKILNVELRTKRSHTAAFVFLAFISIQIMMLALQAK